MHSRALLPAVGHDLERFLRRLGLHLLARVHAADDRLYAARAALYPQLSLTGSVGRTSDSASDLFVSRSLLPPGPLAPPAIPRNNVGTLDGNGLVSGSEGTVAGSDITFDVCGTVSELGATSSQLDSRAPDVAYSATSGTWLVVWQHEEGGLYSVRGQLKTFRRKSQNYYKN